MASKGTEKKGEEKAVKKSTGKTGNKGPQLGSRKDLPSVSYLLAHGNPETAHLPKTWLETWGFPMALCVTFFLSLLTFHYAPHGNSIEAARRYVPKTPPITEPIMKEPEPEILEPVTATEEPEAEL
jgi:hypothetical protein